MRRFTVLGVVTLLAAGCADSSSSDCVCSQLGLRPTCCESDDADVPGDDGRPTAAQVEVGDDGSLRRRFLGGAFVTWNREMPVEIEQAIQGFEPDRPVVVFWAGP